MEIQRFCICSSGLHSLHRNGVCTWYVVSEERLRAGDATCWARAGRDTSLRTLLMAHPPKVCWSEKKKLYLSVWFAIVLSCSSENHVPYLVFYVIQKKRMLLVIICTPPSKKNVILKILGQIIKRWNDLDCPYLFTILGVNWLLHAYMHVHTCQIKQNIILFGTNFESKTSFFLGRREYPNFLFCRKDLWDAKNARNTEHVTTSLCNAYWRKNCTYLGAARPLLPKPLRDCDNAIRLPPPHYAPPGQSQWEVSVPISNEEKINYKTQHLHCIVSYSSFYI
jgi:hypothetical protein